MKFRNLLKSTLYGTTIFLVMGSIAQEQLTSERNISSPTNTSLVSFSSEVSLLKVPEEAFKILVGYVPDSKDLKSLKRVVGKNPIQNKVIEDQLLKISTPKKYYLDLKHSSSKFLKKKCPTLKRSSSYIGYNVYLRNIESSPKIKRDFSRAHTLELFGNSKEGKVLRKKKIEELFPKRKKTDNVVKLGFCNIEFSKGACRIFPSSISQRKRVRELKIINCCTSSKIRGGILEVFSSAEFLPTLQSFTFWRRDISDPDIPEFLRKCPRLTALTLGLLPPPYRDCFRNSPDDEGGVPPIKLDTLRGLSCLIATLTDLSLCAMQLTAEHVKLIAEFKNLTALNLSRSFLSDQDILPIRDLPRLTSLNLSYNCLTTGEVFCNSSLIQKLRPGDFFDKTQGKNFFGEDKEICSLRFSEDEREEIYRNSAKFVTTLKKLNISRNKSRPSNESGFRSKCDMRFLIVFYHLEELDISNNKIYSADSFLFSQNPLVTLGLSGSNALSILRELPYSLGKSLRELGMMEYFPKPEEIYLFRKLRNIEVLGVTLPIITSKRRRKFPHLPRLIQSVPELIQSLSELPCLKVLILGESLEDKNALPFFEDFPSLENFRVGVKDGATAIIEGFASLLLPKLKTFFLDINLTPPPTPVLEAVEKLVKAKKMPSLENIGINIFSLPEGKKVGILERLNKKKRKNINLTLEG